MDLQRAPDWRPLFLQQTSVFATKPLRDKIAVILRQRRRLPRAAASPAAVRVTISGSSAWRSMGLASTTAANTSSSRPIGLARYVMRSVPRVSMKLRADGCGSRSGARTELLDQRTARTSQAE